MYQACGTIRAWLPRRTDDVAARARERLVAALEAEGATRITCDDGVLRFDGGSGRWNTDPLIAVSRGELRVRAVAYDLDTYRAEDAQVRVDYRVWTPSVLVVTLLFAFGIAAMIGGRTGAWRAALIVGLGLLLPMGAIWYLGVRLSFRRFLRRALEQPTTVHSAVALGRPGVRDGSDGPR